MEHCLRWKQLLVCSELEVDQVAQAIRMVDASLDDPPTWLRPWLRRQDGEWRPALPPNADPPTIEPVDP